MSEQQVMDLKTLLECCQCAKVYNQEHEVADNYGGAVGVSIHRTLEHRRMILKEFDDLSEAAKDKNWGKHLLGWADVLHLVCNLTQEAGLETVLSQASCLKHTANMKKSFFTQEEAMDRAKRLALSPEAAPKFVNTTPSGRFTYTLGGWRAFYAARLQTTKGRFLGAGSADRRGKIRNLVRY